MPSFDALPRLPVGAHPGRMRDQDRIATVTGILPSTPSISPERNRPIADTTRTEVYGNSLMLLAESSIATNPREWKKVDWPAARKRSSVSMAGGSAGRVGRSARGRLPLLAFREDYGGDRVAALMLGLLTMADAAFEYKEEFFLLDSLDEQKF